MSVVSPRTTSLGRVAAGGKRTNGSSEGSIFLLTAAKGQRGNSLVWRISGLTRDGMTKHVLRDQISGANGDRDNKITSLFSSPRAGLATIPVLAFEIKLHS